MLKVVIKIINIFLSKISKRFLSQRGQSTLEYVLVTVIAAIVSAILIAVGKPMIVDLISKAFGKIAGTM
jgi:Flp pilus assembly pilin Flp